jgi:hypothetical protein
MSGLRMILTGSGAFGRILLGDSMSLSPAVAPSSSDRADGLSMGESSSSSTTSGWDVLRAIIVVAGGAVPWGWWL